MVAVPGDGKDYAGVCDVCGRPMKLNAANPVAQEYVNPVARREVQESRTLDPNKGPSFEQLAPAAPRGEQGGP